MLNFVATVGPTGYGQVGINLLSSLWINEVETALFPLGGISQPATHHEEFLKASLEYARQFKYDAPCLRLYHQFSLIEQIGKGLKSAYTFFELDKLTYDEVYQLNYQDVVFSPTEWAKQVMVDCGVKTKIEILNPGVDLATFNNLKKKDLGLQGNPTIFFNVGKFMLNKGHDFILEAFDNAFNENDNVALVMACFNSVRVKDFDGPAESKKWEYSFLNSKMGLAGKVHVVPQMFPNQADLSALMNSCDCGFFPARMEGANLPLMESLSLGKNCIATNYSAHTEFVKEAGCHLIDVNEVEDAYDPPFFRKGCGRWAKLGDKQMEQAVTLLRNIHKDKQENNLKFNEAGYNYFRKNTWDKAAKKVKETLEIKNENVSS